MQSIASSLVAAAVPTVAVPTTNPIFTLASQHQSSGGEALASSTIAQEHHTPPTAPLPRHRRPTSSSTARNHNNNCSLSMKSMNTGSFGGDTVGGRLTDHSLTPRGFAAVCVLPCGLRASPPREVFRTNPTSLLKLSQDRPGSQGGLASSSLRSSPRPSIGVVQSWFRNAHPAEMINNLRVLDCFPTLLTSGAQHQQLCLDTDKSTPPASPTTTPTSHQHLHHNATASGDDAGSITVSPSTSFSLGGGVTARGGTAVQPDLAHNKMNNTIITTTTTTVGTGLHGQVHVYTSGLPHSLREKHRHRQHHSSPSAAFARPSSSSATFGQARPAPPAAASRQEQQQPQGSTPRLPHGGGSSPRSSASYSKGSHQHNNHSMPSIRTSKPKAEDFLPPTPKLKSRRYVRQNNHLVPSSTAAADFTTTASSPSSAARPPLNADQILLHNNNGKDAAAAVGTDELLSTQGNLIKLMYRALQEAVAAPSTVVVPHHHSGGGSEDDDNEQRRRAELFDELKVSMDAYQKLQERHHYQTES